MSYKKPEIVASCEATQSYVAGCPTNKPYLGNYIVDFVMSDNGKPINEDQIAARVKSIFEKRNEFMPPLL